MSSSTYGALRPCSTILCLPQEPVAASVHAMSEEIDDALEKGMGDRRLGVEGYNESRWILLDYGDVVIHLFEPSAREYYALEELWGEAKRVPFDPESKAG